MGSTVARTRQWRWETSFEVTQEASITLPKIDVCVTNYDTDNFVFDSVTTYAGEDGPDGWIPGRSREPMTFSRGDGHWTSDGTDFFVASPSLPIGWRQAGDVAMPGGEGSNVDATATLMAELRDTPESDEPVLVEEFCIEADPPSLDSVDVAGSDSLEILQALGFNDTSEVRL